MNQNSLFFSLLIIFTFFHFSTAQAQPESYAALDSLIAAYNQQGVYPKVVKYAELGQKRALREFGKEDTLYIDYTYDLGKAYQQMSNFPEAAACFSEIRPLQEKVVGKDEDYAAILTNLANIYNQLPDHGKAEKLCLEALNILKVDPNTNDYINAANELAITYEGQGKYEQAEKQYLQVLNSSRSLFGDQDLNYAFALNNLAVFYHSLESLEQAEPLYLEGSNIVKAQLGEQHPYYANILSNLASVYSSMENWKKAEKLQKKAIDLHRTAVGENNPQYANYVNNLAVFYSDQGKHKQAGPLYKKALQIRAQTMGTNNLLYANSLNSMAHLHLNLKDYSKALDYFNDCAILLEQLLPPTHYIYIQTLIKVGEVGYLMNNIEQGNRFFQQALQLSCQQAISLNISQAWADTILQTDFPTPLHIRNIVVLLDALYPQQASTADQIILANLATNLIRTVQNNFSDTKDKLRMLSINQKWTALSLKALVPAKKHEQAFQTVERNKSVLLYQNTQQEKAYQLGQLPDSLAQKEETLNQKRDQLRAQIFQTKRDPARQDSLRSQLNITLQEVQSLKKELATKHPQYLAYKYEQQLPEITAIQEQLDEETAILEYAIMDSILYLFYLDKTTLDLIQRPINAKELSKKIQQLHQQLSNYSTVLKAPERAYDNYVDLAYWFYQQLVDPLLKKMPDPIKHLNIVTDGELGHLPFEAFLTKKDTKKKGFKHLDYLCKQFKISYNYSTSLWLLNQNQKARQHNGQLFAVAASYTTDQQKDTMQLRSPTFRNLRKHLQPLPAALAEVEALNKAYGGFLGTDERSTEHSFKVEASPYAVIHLAMHGLLDQKHPMLSSLAFTEDGDSLENNFLQAYEISKMDLNADLVVLSACETGYGRFETGNGIASLARSFMYAGVPSMVVSLWQVNDASTSLIMQNFYANLTKRMDKAAALRKAKLDYIASTDEDLAAHPAFWAPFIQLGDSRPIKLTNKEGKNWVWWAVGVGILLILILGIGIRRKNSKQMD